MHFLKKTLTLFCILPIIVFSYCKADIPDKEKPWSVRIKKFREIDDAEQVIGRLNDRDIDSYVISTYSKKEDFWHAVHSGKFASKNESKELVAKLKKIGIKRTKPLHLKKYQKKMMAYTGIEKKEKKKYHFSGDTSQVPKEIRKQLKHFPIDKSYKIVHVRIGDYKGLHKNRLVRKDFSLPRRYLPRGVKEKDILIKNISVSQATYKDKLFGYKIGITVFSGQSKPIEHFDILLKKTLKGGKHRSEDITIDTDLGNIKGKLFIEKKKSKPKISLVGQFQESKAIIIATGSGLNEKEFRSLLNQDNDNSGLLVFPEVRQNLSILPASTENNIFASFDLAKVESSYARSRRNSRWARKMVGNWNASSWYVNQRSAYYISYFNLNYKKTANSVHKDFRNEKIKAKKNPYYRLLMAYSPMTSHKEKLKNDPKAWYISKATSNELSFHSASVVVAVGSIRPKLKLSKLKQISEGLNIW